MKKYSLVETKHPSFHNDMLWVHRMHFWWTPGNWQKNWQSHGSDCEDNNLLECDAMQSEKSVPTSQEPATLHHLPW